MQIIWAMKLCRAWKAVKMNQYSLKRKVRKNLPSMSQPKNKAKPTTKYHKRICQLFKDKEIDQSTLQTRKA